MDGSWNSVDDFDGFGFRWFGASSVPVTQRNVSFLVGDYSISFFSVARVLYQVFSEFGSNSFFPFGFR